MPPGSLQDLQVLVPESRELDLFCRMLSAEGATAHRCPLVTIRDVEDVAPVEAWLGRLIAGAFDDMIILTGEGLRRLIGVAERANIVDQSIAAIGRLRAVTRGPKPVRALREIGLAPGLQAEIPTTEGVIALLGTQPMHSRRVGVQLYPENPNDKLIGFLESAGATSDIVVPYRYASDTDTDAVAETIERMAAGGFDLVAFTSSPQLQRLVKVAAERALTDQLAAGLACMRIAAVGPIVAAAVRAAGFRVDIEPESLFHLKPLIAAIRDDHLDRR